MDKFDLTEVARGYQRAADELTFMENNYLMGFETLVNTLLDSVDPNDVIILYGCIITVDGQDFDITSGRAFYNNEIFDIEAESFTSPGGELGLFVLDTTDVNMKFQDASTQKGRELRKLKFQSGVSGSGLADHDEVRKVRDLFALDITSLSLKLAHSGPIYSGRPGDKCNYARISKRASIGNDLVFTLTLGPSTGNWSAAIVNLVYSYAHNGLTPRGGARHTLVISNLNTATSTYVTTQDSSYGAGGRTVNVVHSGAQVTITIVGGAGISLSGWLEAADSWDDIQSLN